MQGLKQQMRDCRSFCGTVRSAHFGLESATNPQGSLRMIQSFPGSRQVEEHCDARPESAPSPATGRQ